MKAMKGSEFIKRIQKLAKERGFACSWHPDMGKGSHGVLKLGDTRTIVRNPKDELKTGTYHAIVRAGVKLVRIGRSETGALAGYEDDMGGVFQRQSRRYPLFGGVAIEAGVSGFGLIAHAIAATFDDDGLGVVE